MKITTIGRVLTLFLSTILIGILLSAFSSVGVNWKLVIWILSEFYLLVFLIIGVTLLEEIT